MIPAKQTWCKSKRPGEQYTSRTNNMPCFSSSIRSEGIPQTLVAAKTDQKKTRGHENLRNEEDNSNRNSGQADNILKIEQGIAVPHARR